MTPTEAPQPGPSERPDPEADPTGMRMLLAALPDPGPMPEDLVRRIEARLAVEAHAVRPTSRTHPTDQLVDLAAERSHRRPGRTVGLLGVAAAGLLVATVGLGQAVDGGIFGSRSAGDSAAQYPAGVEGRENDDSGDGAANEAGPDAAGSDAAGSDEAGSDAARSDAAGSDSGGGADGSSPALPDELRIVAALGGVTRQDYRARLEQAAADGSPGDARNDRLTRSEVAGCWAATGSPHRWDSLRAAEARLAGDPVVVLLGRSGDRGEAFLMPWTCTTAIGVQVHADGPALAPVDHTAWPQDR